MPSPPKHYMNHYLEQYVKKTFSQHGKALDLGAGEFLEVIGLKQLGWECDGVDIATGVDLNTVHELPNRPYDLVYSLYVIHKLTHPESLVKTAIINLKIGGFFYLHTFDISDTISRPPIKFTASSLTKLLQNVKFTNITTRVFPVYDNEEGHKHWHQVLEAIAQK